MMREKNAAGRLSVPVLDARADEAFVVQGERYRITVLTSRMLRLEYAEDGCFEDQPTQIVWNRSFDRPAFTVSEAEHSLEIDTEFLHLYYDKKEMTENHLYIDVKYDFTNYGGRWYFGRTDFGDPPREFNLKGTTRTLDRCDGPWYKGSSFMEKVRTRGGQTNREDGDVDLGMGLCDTSGRTFFDDSESLVINADGFVEPRRKGIKDIYYFGYGRDYFGAIHDFYRLSGPVPLLPKYVLGNWWSRYWKYSEESYTALLERFRALNVPFSVVVLDMDWHLVDIPEKYGKGWTGWTWNSSLFPDPDRFLRWLHEKNYRVTLNLHPADGVRAYEAQYREIAEAMGIDPESELPVRFDVTSPEFLHAYFRYQLHPEEDRGVDFWWMDWQQGKICSVEGLDPLWMINHYHHYDLSRDRKHRGVMLSRYSGLGSHRYPIGFSGDVHVSWDSLMYQPYFTATAANVGYTWWSHDIGGHIKGIKDHELYVRWLEFGVFSPINRLHANNHPFCGKEPWRYPETCERIAEDQLRLRHRLLPYIYTMNHQCHEKLRPAVVPVYYHYPMETAAYMYRNEYFFGTELLVQPMVHPTDPLTGYTSEKTWIPEGIWTDVYTGHVYTAPAHGRHAVLSRPLSQQGVLARAGAIVPMAVYAEGDNRIDNPEVLELWIFPGGDGRYTMYEDAGDGFAYEDGAYFTTEITLRYDQHSINAGSGSVRGVPSGAGTPADGQETAEAVLRIRPSGDRSVVPGKRSYILHFRGFRRPEDVQVSEAQEMTYDEETQTLTFVLAAGDVQRDIEVRLEKTGLPDRRQEIERRIFTLLDRVQGDVEKKEYIWKAVLQGDSAAEVAQAAEALEIPDGWKYLLLEMFS